MIWADTTRYGCGAARNYDTGKTVIVGFFYPAGNIEGKWDENIKDWNHAEFLKTCNSIWRGGEPGNFSMNKRNNKLEDLVIYTLSDL